MVESKKRNRIVIIGNGFDLAHGIKTSYNSFVDWLWNNKVDEINQSLVSKVAAIKDKENKDQLVSEEEKKFSITDDDGFFSIDEERKSEFVSAYEMKKWVTFNNGLLETLEKKRNKLKDPKWSDIENTYYECLLKCNNCYNTEKEEKKHEDLSIIKLNREFRELRIKLLAYLKHAYDSVDKLDPAFTGLISRMKRIIDAPDAYDNEVESIVFISFNYTSTLELYGYSSTDENSKKHEIIHIHGSLLDETSIIFGYGDELDSNSLDIQENKDNAFLEFNKAVLYARNGAYQKIIPYIYGDNDYEVYILGHSCANSDRALLNEIFDNERCKLIKYFYYSGPPGIEENFKEQISNLYRIFGDNHRNFRKVFCPLHASESIPQIGDVLYKSIVNENTSKEIEILGIQFVKVKGGRLDDRTKIEDFWIGKYPVTQSQWRNIMGFNPSTFIGDELPVEFISYFDCKRFLLSLKSQSGNSFSLPTEEQWRYVARVCGTVQVDSIDSIAWYDNNSNNITHPVGQKEPNVLGLFDLYGNVWEFAENIQNEKAESNDVNAYGGSFRSSSSQISSSSQPNVIVRRTIDKNFRSEDLGVRLVLIR